MAAESVARDQREGENPDDGGIIATVSIAAFEGDRSARSRGVGGRVVSLAASAARGLAARGICVARRARALRYAAARIPSRMTFTAGSPHHRPSSGGLTEPSGWRRTNRPLAGSLLLEAQVDRARRNNLLRNYT